MEGEEDEDEPLCIKYRKKAKGGNVDATTGGKKVDKGKGVAKTPDTGEEGEEVEEDNVPKRLPGSWTVNEGNTLSTSGVVIQLANFIDLEGEVLKYVEGDAPGQIEAIVRKEFKHMLAMEVEGKRLRGRATEMREANTGLVAEVTALKRELSLKVAVAEAAEQKKREVEEGLRLMKEERDVARVAKCKVLCAAERAHKKRREESERCAMLLVERENAIHTKVAKEAVDMYKASAIFKRDAKAYMSKGTFCFLEKITAKLREAAPELDLTKITTLGPYIVVEAAQKSSRQVEEEKPAVESPENVEEEEEEEEGDALRTEELELGAEPLGGEGAVTQDPPLAVGLSTASGDVER